MSEEENVNAIRPVALHARGVIRTEENIPRVAVGGSKGTEPTHIV